MGKRTDHFMSAAVRAAARAKEWAIVAAREADRLLEEDQKQAESEDRRRRLKQTLSKTGRVLRAAGQAALVAAVLAGIAAARAERGGPKLPKAKRRKLASGR
jgi:regulator of protease activity HflC (stomatin/prohibitin superfamily)